MKKVIGFLLVFCLLLQLPSNGFLSYAAETGSGNATAEKGDGLDDFPDGDVTGGDVSGSDVSGNNAGTPRMILLGSVMGAGSKLEVVIKSVYEFSNGTSFSVSLTKTEGTEKNAKTLELMWQGEERYAVGKASFWDVAEGTYMLEISADRYTTYQQEIKVENGVDYSVELYTSQKAVESFNDAHPGTILLGNLLKKQTDGGDEADDITVSQADVDYLIDQIFEAKIAALKQVDDSKTGESVTNEKTLEEITDVLADVNRDGLVDIEDLQYLTENLYETNTIATVTTFVSPKEVVVEKADTTSIKIGDGETVDDGALKEALFTDEGPSLGLTPKMDGEVISDTNPVEIGLTLDDGESNTGVYMEGVVVKSPVGDSGLKKGEIDVTYYDSTGTQYTTTVKFDGTASGGTKVAQILTLVGTVGVTAFRTSEITPTVKMEASGNIVVDLGTRVAVKKVTIRVTATMKQNSSLAEISKVEFLNEMASRIPEPELNIPELKQENVVNGSKTFTVTWPKEENITGYEVEIEHFERGTGTSKASQVIFTDVNTIILTALNGEEIVNLDTYRIRVRSVNTEWRSPYSEYVEARPRPDGPPPAPDNVVVTGGQNRITMNWKKMKDTEYYMVHYQKKDAPNEETPIRVDGNSYMIQGLGDLETYTVWVVGFNTDPDTGEEREGPASFKSTVTTTSVSDVVFPRYNVINTPAATGDGGKNVLMNGIKDAFYSIRDTREKGMRGGGQLDKVVGSAQGVVDNDYSTYYYLADWDDGCSYQSPDKGVTVQLDQTYDMNLIMFADVLDNINYSGVSVYYLDQDGKEQQVTVRNFTARSDENGRRYYVIKLDKKINTNQVRLCLKQWSRYIGIAEIRFYQYDSLEDEVLNMYEDDFHLVLKDDVTLATINDFRARLQERRIGTEVDQENGDLHPEYDLINLELDNAERILRQDFTDKDFVTVNPNITSSNDGHLGFGGLNAWQPLGITAYEGEKLIIYVGHSSLSYKPGDNTKLRVVATQYHAESSPFMAVIASPNPLKIGYNEITIPKIASFDFERGGSLYIEYTGNDPNDYYAVRVVGGEHIPVLNLYKVDQSEWKNLAAKYIEDLEKHVAGQEALHNKEHLGSEIAAIDKEYDNQNCILGATEIMLDQMMYSVSGEQILKGLSDVQGTDKKAEKLVESLKAMEEMMTLFYHHKGLSNNQDAGAKNKLPVEHLNIRYHRMFAGAFMYASGNHIGIEWDSVPGLAGGVPIVTDEKGRYQSGRYFGWGIAHEIGHDINQGTYAIAEVTNNYFSVLAQADDKTLDSVRFEYENVYDKVTSGAIGRASNVFTQLGMYWQLHLAYDDGYNYKVYDNYKDQFNNLFFARVDTYARDTSVAPKGVETEEKDEAEEEEDTRIALTLTGDIDQKFMRLATAAAQKDLTEFFQRWGMVPDSDTLAYAAQFPKEERAIYYVNDLARAYRVENADAEAEKTVAGKNVLDTSVVKATVDPAVQNQVTLTLSTTDCDPEVILGYEINRYITIRGKQQKETIGFIMQNVDENGKPVETEFVDTITSINNRVFTYEVVAVDKFLNRSNPVTLDSIKVSHDGNYDKTDWTVTTNMVSVDDGPGKSDAEWDPCEPEMESAVTRVLDNDVNSVYTGSCIEADPEIIIALNQVKAVAALKYNAPADENRIGKYAIEISLDGETWTKVAEDTFSTSGVQTVYFGNGRDNWICTYDAAYVKLTALNQSGKHISVGELDLLGPSGDNVELLNAGTSKAYGYLTDDYVFDASAGMNGIIPKGSLVFVGQYKGNPAYNVVVLYDQNGKIVGGTDAEGNLIAEQIILADVPDDGLPLGETSDGRFVYWIHPENGEDIPAMVRAELYRVDDALTNEGDRLVSDTFFVTIDRDKIPEITLEGSGE